MSILAPKFRLSYFLSSLTDNIFWIVVIFTLIGLPILFIVLFFVQLPVYESELINPFLTLSWIFHPELALPLLKAFLLTEVLQAFFFQ